MMLDEPEFPIMAVNVIPKIIIVTKAIANLASHSIKKAKNGNNRIFTNGRKSIETFHSIILDTLITSSDFSYIVIIKLIILFSDICLMKIENFASI